MHIDRFMVPFLQADMRSVGFKISDRNPPNSIEAIG